jgi:hypothetical protein
MFNFNIIKYNKDRYYQKKNYYKPYVNYSTVDKCKFINIYGFDKQNKKSIYNYDKDGFFRISHSKKRVTIIDIRI